MKQQPEQVRRFREASLKGWAYAMEHSEAMIDLILERYNTQQRSRKHLQYEAAQMREMVQPLLVELGYMHYDRWRHIEEIFQNLGFLQQKVDLNTLFYQPQQGEEPWRAWLLPTLLVLLAMAGITLLVTLWNRHLKHQVALQTQELQQLTEHMTLVLESMNEGLIVTDANHKIVRVNRKLLRLTGCSAEALQQQGLNQLFEEAEEEGLLQEDAQRSLKTQRGELIPVQVRGALLSDTEGNHAMGAVLVVHDLRDRVRAENREQYAAFQAGVADMAAAVLHNIGNVITGMSGNVIKLGQLHRSINKLSTSLGRYEADASMECEALQQQQQKIPQGTIATLEKICQQLEEQKMLDKLEMGIRHVGDIISIQQGAARPVIHATQFLLSGMVKDTLNLIEDRLQKYNTTLTVEIDPEIGSVRLPRNPLMQMLLNLIKNSLEAILDELLVDESLQGTIRLTITHASDQQFVLSVEDNGCGLEQGQLEHIFESGFTTKQRGSGYGLHSAANFVHSLGGEIVAESPGPHQGMKIAVTLPIEVKKQEAESEQ